jgi:CubicO group peptidase (beta-lactamase class C family)
VIYARGLGLRDAEHHLPVTADTLFAIGSCSKVFTALLGVMGEDAGKLSLDDPPRKYLPYFKLQDPELDAAVTLRDLMSHRTGLDSEDESLWWEGKLNREEVIRAGMAPAPIAKLRQEFHYNNILYSAAGEAISRAHGKSWEELVQHRLFEPLGMTESDLSRTAMQARSDHAQGYEQPGPAGRPGPSDPPIPVAMRDLTNVAPAGAVNSNARDMARWLRFMLDEGAVGGRRLVSKQRFAELSANNSTVREGTTYGLGWGCKDWQGHKTCGHNGGIDGFNAVVSTMPDRDLGFVMLTNVSLSDLMKEIADIVYGHLVVDAKPAASH